MSGRFRPPLWASAATLAGLAVFATLGFWQLDRARQKRVLFDQFDRGSDIVWTAAQARAAIARDEDVRYRRVRLEGRYDSQRQLFLDGMVTNGRAGLDVLTPLQFEDGDAIAVNRGWVPMPASRSVLPEIPVSSERRTVVGRLAPFPAPGLRLGESRADNESDPWPRLALFPSAGEYRQMLGYGLSDWLLLLDPAEPDGYVRQWSAGKFGPERHVGYAVQWFAFDVVLLVIYLVTNYRKGVGHES